MRSWEILRWSYGECRVSVGLLCECEPGRPLKTFFLRIKSFRMLSLRVTLSPGNQVSYAYALSSNNQCRKVIKWLDEKRELILDCSND